MKLRLNWISTLVLLMFTSPLMAQVAIQDSLNYLTDPLLQHPQSKGLLLDKSISIFDARSHTIKNQVTHCSSDSLDFLVYAIAKMGREQASFPKNWAQQMRDYHFRDTATSIPVVAMMLGVDKIRQNAQTEQKLTLHQRQLQLSSSWSDAMEEDTLVWISPLVPSIQHPTHTTFRLDSLHWVSNGIQATNWRWRRLHSPTWQVLTFGNNVTFPSVAGKLDTIELEMTCNARVKIIRMTVSRTWNQVPPENVRQRMIQATNSYQSGNNVVGYQLQWVQIGLMSFQMMMPVIQFGPKFNKALVSIDYVDQSANPVLQKPFVIVEGIDFGYKERPVGCAYGRCGSLGYYDFLNARRRDYNPANPDELLPEFEHARMFSDSLKRAGYDVVFVDFELGADYIQDNSMVLVEVLRQLKQNMAGNDGIVVCGASMGGLVTRYALTWMEKQNEAHCVRDFISFDSPQEGANVPLALQEFTDYLARYNSFDLFDQAVDYRNRRFNAPASRQMMLVNYEMPVGQVHPLRTQFLQELQQLGNYPVLSRKIALSNGTLAGHNLPVGVGGNIMNLNIDASKWAIVLGASYNVLLGFAAHLFAAHLLDYKANLYSLCGNQSNVIFRGDAIFPGNEEFVYSNASCVPYDHLAGGWSEIKFSVPFPSLNLMPIYYPKFSLISTSSALGMVPTGTSPVMLDKSFSPGASIPFDAYWSAATNEKHVQISYTMIDFVLARLRETSQQSLTRLSLNTFSQLNLGRHSVSAFNSSVQVSSGKVLSLNAGRTILGDGTTVDPVPGSHLTFEVGACKPVQVRVSSGAQLILGNNSWNNSGVLSSTLRVKTGSSLWIEGSLKLEGKSVLIIEQGATLRLSPGNIVELAHGDCKLELNGQLVLDPQASFTPVFKGVMVVGPHASISATTSGDFTLAGTASEPARMLFLSNAQFEIPAGIAQFNLLNTQLVFQEDANLMVETHAFFNNLYAKAHSFSGPQTNNIRLNLNKSNQVIFSKFEYLKNGIEMVGQSLVNDLIVHNSNFFNCQNGIYQQSGGLNLTSSGFFRNSQAVLCQTMTRKTTIATSTFEHNVGGVFIESNQPLQVEISRSKFSNHAVCAVQMNNCEATIFNSLLERSSTTAVLLMNTKLRMTCSQLLNNAQVVELDLGSELDISEYAGNTFRNNNTVFMFYFSDPNLPDKLNWRKGKNDLRWNSQLISGSFDVNAIAFLPGSLQTVNTRIGPFEYYSVDAQDNLVNAAHPTTTSQLYWNVYGSYLSTSGVRYPIFVEPLLQLSEEFSCGDKIAVGDDAPIDLNPSLFDVAGRPMSNTMTKPEGAVYDWKVFPNPASEGWIEVQLPEFASEEEVDLELIDFSGRSIKQWADRQGGNWRLDVSGLASGWYQLRVLSEHHTYPVRKVHIQNGL